MGTVSVNCLLPVKRWSKQKSLKISTKYQQWRCISKLDSFRQTVQCTVSVIVVPSQIKSNHIYYFIVRPKVDQRAGQLSLPPIGITKMEKNRTNIKTDQQVSNTRTKVQDQHGAPWVTIIMLGQRKYKKKQFLSRKTSSSNKSSYIKIKLCCS